MAEENRRTLALLTGADACRSHVSRAYYAAYALVTHCLDAVGASYGRTNPAHREARSLVKRHLAGRLRDQTIQDVLQSLHWLYTMRLEADYKPASPVTAADAARAKREVERLFMHLRNLS